MVNHITAIFTTRVSQNIAGSVLGHAGGFAFMEQTLSLLRGGDCQACLVGGVDSYLDATTLEWLDETEQLHSEATIWGFCPGEGAGFCLITTHEFADRFDLRAPVELLAAGSATEPNRIRTETVCIGEGLSAAFRGTLAALPDGHHVDHTICDMNGEPYRGNEFGFAVMRSRAWFADGAGLTTPADCWGDQGAASAPLFVLLAAFAARKGYAPGPYTLLWASSDGGLRACALLQSMVP